MYEALDCITDAAEAAGMTVLEAAVRWTQHHSAVDASKGDAVLIGVSRIECAPPLPPIILLGLGGCLPSRVSASSWKATSVLSACWN